MKRIGFVVLSLALLLVSSAAAAADFDWVNDFNARSRADPAGFRTMMAARFQIGDAQVTALLGNVSGPADAYIVLRFGEMSRHPFDYVLREYKASRGKGWGVLAQRLGIKPGSEEFHALKRGHDLYNGNEGKGKGKGKGKKVSGPE